MSLNRNNKYLIAVHNEGEPFVKSVIKALEKAGVKYTLFSKEHKGLDIKKGGDKVTDALSDDITKLMPTHVIMDFNLGWSGEDNATYEKLKANFPKTNFILTGVGTGNNKHLFSKIMSLPAFAKAVREEAELENKPLHKSQSDPVSCSFLILSQLKPIRNISADSTGSLDSSNFSTSSDSISNRSSPTNTDSEAEISPLNSSFTLASPKSPKTP
jgi:hypothetical protein